MTSSDALSEPPRRTRHYGRRKGPKLSAWQSGLLQDLLPKIALAPETARDPYTLFAPAAPKDVWLEVGFGAGEHIAGQAAVNPDVGFLGCEPYVAGTAKLLAKMAAGGLRNIRIHHGDAQDIIEALPDHCIGRVFVLFPDPWPKKRHHKRRFISTAMLDSLARVMRPGSELRFATDDHGYLLWSLERLCAHGAFLWQAVTPGDWRSRCGDWPETRYESKAKQAGRVCTYLRFARL